MTTNTQLDMSGAPNVPRNSNVRFLNSSMAADEWMTRAATNRGSRSMLADPDKIEDADSSAAALNAGVVLRDAIATVEKLTRDESRTLPQRNEAAAKLANDVAGKIEQHGQTIERSATALFESGKSEAINAFAPDLSRQAYDAEIMRWIREESAKENGVLKVHEMVRKNKAVAGVVVNGEPFLLGLNEGVHTRMRDDAIAAHAPEAWAKMLRGVALTELPERFKQTAANVRRFFFDPIQRAKMGTRVQGLD